MRTAPHKAGWQSGYAAACKAVDAGSIPTPASRCSPDNGERIITARSHAQQTDKLAKIVVSEFVSFSGSDRALRTRHLCGVRVRVVYYSASSC